ncbi:MAG: D-aminoacylase, partial [Saprospiraceae bacterium]|nr:D-aminoacylase [Saprospiraceae bacterium]
MTQRVLVYLSCLAMFLGGACASVSTYEVVIYNAQIYDGTGAAPFTGTVAIQNDTIAALGPDLQAKGALEIDAAGMAISPGFINMLSWATESLIHDGRGLSDIAQGVTLEVMGEGMSMGPLNDEMKADMQQGQGDIAYEVTWTTLGEYLQFLEDKGVSPNVASFVGATTVRVHEIGYEDRLSTDAEMDRMKA